MALSNEESTARKIQKGLFSLIFSTIDASLMDKLKAIAPTIVLVAVRILLDVCLTVFLWGSVRPAAWDPVYLALPVYFCTTVSKTWPVAQKWLLLIGLFSLAHITKLAAPLLFASRASSDDTVVSFSLWSLSVSLIYGASMVIQRRQHKQPFDQVSSRS